MNNIEKIKQIIGNEVHIQGFIGENENLRCDNSQEIVTQIEALYNPKPVSFKRFRAEKKGVYWYVGSAMKVESMKEVFDNIDNYRHLIGNYYETKEQAELAQKKAILLQKLKDIIREEKGGANVLNQTIQKWRIYFNMSKQELFVAQNDSYLETDIELYMVNKSTFNSIKSQMTIKEIKLALGYGDEE